MGIALASYCIGAWGLAPAEVFYQRNNPGAAAVTIANIKPSIDYVRAEKGGAVADAISRVHDSGSCAYAIGQLTGWISNFPIGRDQSRYAYELGFGIGSAWSHCRPDNADPAQWTAERNAGSSALSKAQGALSSIPPFAHPMDSQLVFEMMRLQEEVTDTNTAPFSTDLFTSFTNMISKLQSALTSAGA